jgi:N-acetylglutamate synthase-like GNAT family acetyltransferase
VTLQSPIFRRAGPADAASIQELTRQVYAKWIPLIGREPRPMTADYSASVQEHWIDLVEDGGSVIALIEMIPKDSFLLVENVAVDEKQQGHGLGAALLRHAEDMARYSGLPEIRLYTNAAFAGNLAFYERIGFSETGREPLPDGGIMVNFRKPVS